MVEVNPDEQQSAKLGCNNLEDYRDPIREVVVFEVTDKTLEYVKREIFIMQTFFILALAIGVPM